MKQTLEEAAREYSSQWAWNSQPDMWQSEKDFKAGVEWQAKQSPWISVEERFGDLKGAINKFNREAKWIGYTKFIFYMMALSGWAVAAVLFLMR